MKFDPHHFARAYTALLYDFANEKSAWADIHYSFNMSDHNAYSQSVWVRHASDCDNLRDEVEALIFDAECAAQDRVAA